MYIIICMMSFNSCVCGFITMCAYMHPSGIVIECLPPSVEMCTFASNGKALNLRP